MAACKHGRGRSCVEVSQREDNVAADHRILLVLDLLGQVAGDRSFSVGDCLSAFSAICCMSVQPLRRSRDAHGVIHFRSPRPGEVLPRFGASSPRPPSTRARQIAHQR